LTPKFKIRKAKKEDSQGIYNVLKTAFEKYKSYYTAEGYADTILSLKGVIKRLKKMNLYVAVLFDLKIVGTIGWSKISNEEAHIRGMAVHPDFQGTGIAKELLKMAERDIKRTRFSYITLDTTKVLKRAQRFYEKNGYRRTEEKNEFFGMELYQFCKKL